jgi:hypothetical protein
MEEARRCADPIPVLAEQGRQGAGQTSFDPGKAMAELRGQPLALRRRRAADRERREGRA